MNQRKIWIDNDGCPNVIREMVYKTSNRLKLPVVVVGNSNAKIPQSEWISSVVVPGGFDAADNYIVANVQAKDLVITSDVLLAKQLVEKNALALNSQGTLFNEQNIGEKVAVRNLMQELRSGDGLKGGPAPFGEKDKKKFAAILDQITSKMKRNI